MQNDIFQSCSLLKRGLPVIPAKIVIKIQKREVLDMDDLLKDYIEPEKRRNSVTGGAVDVLLANRPSRR